jgi:glycosyltransferase involved in cell wall biosynthesis
VKVLFSVRHPYAWAHGGVQVLVEALMRRLPAHGVAVEPLRWWDAAQQADLLILFHNPTTVEGYAREKGIRVVNYVYLDSTSSLSLSGLWTRRLAVAVARKLSPFHAAELGWRFPELADAQVYASEGDRRMGAWMFGADPSRGTVIPNGVDDRCFEAARGPHDGDFLVSVGTIHPRKNTLLLARAARRAGVPVVFIGKSYAEDDHMRAFRSLVDGRTVRYAGAVSDEEKFGWLSRSRGFVLWSRGESGCLSALEALAAGCPALLPDLRWARWNYDGHAAFAPLRGEEEMAASLRRFYDAPPRLPAYPALTWDQAAGRYAALFQKVLERPA